MKDTSEDDEPAKTIPRNRTKDKTNLADVLRRSQLDDQVFIADENKK
jgi:hypothetical protein